MIVEDNNINYCLVVFNESNLKVEVKGSWSQHTVLISIDYKASAKHLYNIIIMHVLKEVNNMRREEINLLLKVFFTSCERRFLIDFVEDNQICFVHVLEPVSLMVTFMEDENTIYIDTECKSIKISRRDISELIAVSYVYIENLFDLIDENIIKKEVR